MIIFLNVPNETKGPGASCLLNSILHYVSIKLYWKNQKVVSEIKWWTQPAWPACAHPGPDPKKSASQPHWALNPPLRTTFKEPVSKDKNNIA